MGDEKMDLLPMEMMDEAAACLKVLAHPMRLRIVDILMQGDFAVHEIADLCEVKQHQVCEHLRLMQNCRMLSSKRVGRTVHYSIESPHLPALLGCVRDNCLAEE